MLQVKRIENEAQVISQNGTAQSGVIAQRAHGDYTATVETARSEGLRSLYQRLNIVDQAHKNSFDYLRTLRGLDHIHLTVDFQQRIVGGLK